MIIFEQIEFLPIAYFLVLMSVVCATVLAKLLGWWLIEATSGPLQTLLSRRVNVPVTGDEIASHLFEQRQLSNINSQIIFTLLGDIVRWIGVVSLAPVPLEALNFHKHMYPEKHWSGCPPNLA
ncbi:MAG: hypothetical protein K0Q50_2250 [Vampirovibrio sp.]|jgi:hypothetical protein|nr:hypothetical protein [Vampirovibrio sp.]